MWNQFWQQGVEGIKYVAGKAVNLINCPPPVLSYYDPVSDELENLSASEDQKNIVGILRVETHSF